MIKDLIYLGIGPKHARPVYSKDSNYILFSVRSGVQVYSAKTGIQIHKLSTDIQKTPTIALAKQSLVYMAFPDGEIFVWDFKQGIQIKEINVREGIKKIVSAEPELLYIAENVTKSKKGKVLATQDVVKKFTSNSQVYLNFAKVFGEENFRNLNYGFRYFDINLELNTAVVVLDYRPTCYYVCKFGDYPNILEFEHSDEITLVKMHPTEPCVVLGDVIGKITYSYCINLMYREEPKTTFFHWHQYQVLSLDISSDGHYMLSGGLEDTLCLWQVQTRHTQFIPRLSSHLINITISPNQMQYSVCLNDNSLLLISASSLEISQTISGLKAATVDKKLYPHSVGLTVDPISQCLVLNGRPSTLQFYDTARDQNAKEIDLMLHNRVAGDKVYQPHIRHASFTTEGDWMVTVDTKNNLEFQNETFLNFWKYNESKQTFQINTRVDKAHVNGINSICLSNTICGTTSDDGTFKIWEQSKAECNYLIDIACWKFKAVASYKGYTPKTIAISDDESLVAVGFKNIIALYSAVGELQTKLVFSSENIQKLLFVKTTPYLIAIDNTKLTIWNILSCSVVWSLNMSVQKISLLNKQFAVTVATKQTQVYVFNPISPVPIDSFEIKDKDILGFIWLPSGFYFLNQQLEIATTQQDIVKQEHQETQQQIRMFAAAKTKTVSVENIEQKSLGFLDAPSHIIAPPSKLVEQFFKLSLKPKTRENIVHDVEIVEEHEKEVVKAEYEQLEKYDFLLSIFK
ncbi:WD repeat-containing protein 75 [Boothiomyces sp. JEL0866]|nr:WD repeat-containing protein 75 [Boothiomyces sp. JEL0866]